MRQGLAPSLGKNEWTILATFYVFLDCHTVLTHAVGSGAQLYIWCILIGSPDPCIRGQMRGSPGV